MTITTDSHVDAMIARASALAPAIQAEREAIAGAGQLPPVLLQEMAAAGLFRMYTPVALGGFEVNPIVFTRVVEEVARVDGSAGWLVALAASYGALPAYVCEEVARQLLYEPTATIAGTITPSGRAVVVPGGYRVSGRWAFGSGILHSRWVIGNCVVIDGDGPRLSPSSAPELRIVIAPVRACRVLDTWHTAGVRGTGSHDYTIEDVFVRDDWTLAPFSAPAHQPGTLYKWPLITLFAAAIAAPALGMARGAIDALVDLAGAKTPTGSQNLLRDRPMVQADVARAEALLGSGRAFLFAALGEASQTLAGGDALTIRQRAKERIAAANAAINAAQAVDLMYNAGGATSNYAGSPLQAFARDVHAATQHIAVVQQNYEIAGRVLLGLDPGTPRF